MLAKVVVRQVNYKNIQENLNKCDTLDHFQSQILITIACEGEDQLTRLFIFYESKN